MINKRAIKKLAQEIVDHFHPQQVILFGSYAYGTPTEDSDVDLLVIMETEERNLPQALKISRAISHPFPMDLVVLKPQEVQKRLAGGDLVLQEILTKGEVLFEDGDAGIGLKKPKVTTERLYEKDECVDAPTMTPCVFMRSSASRNTLKPS